MPVNSSLMNALIKQYGKRKGAKVYYSMENQGSSSFKRGLSTATKEGHIAQHGPSSKKKSRKKRSG